MLNEIRVGPLVSMDGAVNPARADREGSLVVTAGHGPLFEAARRGNIFSFCAQAALSLPASLTSTAPVFTLHNPGGSGKLLSVLSVGFAFSAAPAAAVVLAVVANFDAQQAAPTATTPGIVQSTYLPNSAPAAVGRIYTVATLGAAPTVARVVASIVAAASITPAYIRDNIEGGLVIAPNGYVCFAGSAAAAGFPSITWEEVSL